MIKFNDDTILTGYIKQVLHTFNLPTVKVYTQDDFLYQGRLVIKDRYIQEYDAVTGKLTRVIPFDFNKPILNYTKNLKINNNIYDSHTHEYLGEYLRFIRDFKHLNLMSMYNCFSNNIVNSLAIYWDNNKKVFETDNSKYKIYAIPVKFDKKYTIALSTTQPVEIICGLYDKTLVTQTVSAVEIPITDVLSAETYKKITYSDYKKPFIYDCLYNNSNLKNKFLYDHEDCLKLFIKIPNLNETAITILEGEYLNTNAKLPNDKINGKWEHASTVVNYELSQAKSDNFVEVFLNNSSENAFYYVNEEEQINLKKVLIDNDVWYTGPNVKLSDSNLTSSLELLELNSNVSHPFATRLIEYLTHNAITNLDTISDNVERIQEAFIRRNQENKTGLDAYRGAGVWETKYKNIGYDIAVEEGLVDSKFDVLGYIDKDIERKLGSDIDIYAKE